MSEQVRWGHVTLAGAVVVLVMIASAGSSWISLAGWIGAAAVFLGWCALLVHVRAAQVRPRESENMSRSGHRGR